MRYCPQCYAPALGAVAFCEPCHIGFIEIPTLEYVEEAGFEHPDWEGYFPRFDAQVPPDKVESAWKIMTRWWLHRLVQNLGGTYRLHEDRKILLISDGDPEENRLLSSFGNYSLELIQKLLEIRDPDYFKYQVVVLLFSDPDDYYDYISHFYPEGEFSKSGGCHINRHYGHIALIEDIPSDARRCLVHELAHYAVRATPLPCWLNEALAMGIERAACTDSFWLDGETAANLREFWSEETIQFFWSGQSFHHPEASGPSYALAAVLWELMNQKKGDQAAFVREAHIRDAGQDAALKHLGMGLEILVEEFLGPGDWRPNRRKLAESFQRAQDKSSE